jgi:LmbE family N-acetylglucosaminyl deacetylase
LIGNSGLEACRDNVVAAVHAVSYVFVMSDIDLSRSAIVAAHPDDEVLWFGSLVPKVGRIVLCYGMDTAGTARAGRQRVVEEYPYRSVEFFDLVQPGSYTKATWPNPVLGPLGLVLGKPSPAHEASYDAIVARLRQSLRGMTTVFTHNSWGEYGHEEHTLIYAAVNALKEECGFDLYISPYVGAGMLNLCRQVIDGGINRVARFQIDQVAIATIAELYRKHGVWTWFHNWDWPDEESFFRLGSEGRIRTQSLPFEIIDTPPHERK